MKSNNPKCSLLSLIILQNWCISERLFPFTSHPPSCIGKHITWVEHHPSSTSPALLQQSTWEVIKEERNTLQCLTKIGNIQKECSSTCLSVMLKEIKNIIQVLAHAHYEHPPITSVSEKGIFSIVKTQSHSSHHLWNIPFFFFLFLYSSFSAFHFSASEERDRKWFCEINNAWE